MDFQPVGKLTKEDWSFKHYDKQHVENIFQVICSSTESIKVDNSVKRYSSTINLCLLKTKPVIGFNLCRHIDCTKN